MIARSPAGKPRPEVAPCPPPIATSVEQVDTRYLETLLGYNARRAALTVIGQFLPRMAAFELRPVDFSVLSLITLIALAAKNAILIFEFAVMLREQGKSFAEAATESARQRLRPIVMTSFAFILGVVPLAIASGASANSRHSIGTGVIGGMLGATVIAIFFIPMFYVLLGKFSARFDKKKEDQA